MTGIARMYIAACASGALILTGLVIYAEIDRAIRRRISTRKRPGYIDLT
jgi:uncharacterized iron-regulated membrane protein